MPFDPLCGADSCYFYYICVEIPSRMKTVTEIFVNLGERLSDFGADWRSREVVRRAMSDNEWFTESDIMRAVEAIRLCMLDRQHIEKWLAAYPAPAQETTPCRVAIIMAGNIPLVGFFDLMCVVASGNVAVVKYSSKDHALISYVVSLLSEIEPALQIEEYADGVTVDAVIATGGESANRWFDSTFGDVPHLFRGNRHSVAVLSGEESAKEMEGLADDIFSYSGLGCRSVSLVFVPHNYSLQLPSRVMCQGYRNNCLRTKALLLMTGVEFVGLGDAVMVEGMAEFPNVLSRINVVRYDSVDEVAQWLATHDTELQCVVSSMKLHQRTVGFGRAQYPELTDYADDVDVMKFLLTLRKNRTK